MYDNLRKGMPALMAFRYQTQIFDKLHNGANGGTCVTNYDDKENPVTFKAIPVMNYDPTTMFNAKFADDTHSFDAEQLENSMKTNLVFKYPQCVIDLNPTVSSYSVTKTETSTVEVHPTQGTFPITFTAGEDANDPSDVYKTTKILLQRVAELSEDNEVSFSMGSRSSDYAVINDPYKKMYKDVDSIDTVAKNDVANVKLFAGGSYQKSDAFWNIPKRDSHGNPDPVKKKYRRNKHFYIDPLELTIAQWCHAHGWHTKGAARGGLNAATDKANLDEMRRSYWKYLYTYEKDKWTALKNSQSLTEGDIDSMINQLASNDILTSNNDSSQIYNPLEDTRPYYYATYANVRGVTNLYDSADGDKYTLSGSDEYQLSRYREGKT